MTIKTTKLKINQFIYIEEEYFFVEKTSDKFKEVDFIYGNKTWYGALPKKLEKQGLSLNDAEFKDRLQECYQLLDPKNKNSWIAESNNNWNSKESATYKVLHALHSGNWECRVCGPVPNVNPQPAARLVSLKKQGYIIGSRRRLCSACSKKTMHDILIMLPRVESRFSHGNELRKPMSKLLKLKIMKELEHIEVCFNVKRSAVELLIDHKFPSQRWVSPESDNKNDMTLQAIRDKFQLLSNQTNMWKSRYCDHCVKTDNRGDFMGIKWFYLGNEKWQGKTLYDENGCKGCPWYDLELWKQMLIKKLT